MSTTPYPLTSQQIKKSAKTGQGPGLNVSAACARRAASFLGLLVQRIVAEGFTLVVEDHGRTQRLFICGQDSRIPLLLRERRQLISTRDRGRAWTWSGELSLTFSQFFAPGRCETAARPLDARALPSVMTTIRRRLKAQRTEDIQRGIERTARIRQKRLEAIQDARWWRHRNYPKRILAEALRWEHFRQVIAFRDDLIAISPTTPKVRAALKLVRWYITTRHPVRRLDRLLAKRRRPAERPWLSSV